MNKDVSNLFDYTPISFIITISKDEKNSESLEIFTDCFNALTSG